jgi:hypothetical protein
MTWKSNHSRNPPCSLFAHGFIMYSVMRIITYPSKDRIFHDFWSKKWATPVTFEPKGRNQNQSRLCNISLSPTSAPSFVKFGWPPFPASGTLSGTMTLKLTPPGNKVSHLPRLDWFERFQAGIPHPFDQNTMITEPKNQILIEHPAVFTTSQILSRPWHIMPALFWAF